ncbi:hypothetical protein [Hafnia sp. HMSC23F03]|uniref:hypothetical protein n=1 Tax=Hafnia sp. HMSC23F03 TaxID=1581059 RepID=UPI00352A94AD
MTTNADGSVNVAANATAHAVVGAVVAELRAENWRRERLQLACIQMCGQKT